jgi:hypothetical protein
MSSGEDSMKPDQKGRALMSDVHMAEGMSMGRVLLSSIFNYCSNGSIIQAQAKQKVIP